MPLRLRCLPRITHDPNSTLDHSSVQKGAQYTPANYVWPVEMLDVSPAHSEQDTFTVTPAPGMNRRHSPP